MHLPNGYSERSPYEFTRSAVYQCVRATNSPGKGTSFDREVRHVHLENHFVQELC